MADDGYIELAQELLDAMRKFISESEPGKALIPLHEAYAVVKATVDAGDPNSDVARRNRQLDELRDQFRGHTREQADAHAHADAHAENMANWERTSADLDAWKKLDRDVRKGRVLTVLRNDALTRAEIAERLPNEYSDIDIYRGGHQLVPVLNDMLAAGELEREKRPRTPNCTIKGNTGYLWVWRRSTKPLSAELQDLAQRLKEA